MGKSPSYHEYLEKKYQEVEDKPITGKPSRRKPPKKSDHAHQYVNCIFYRASRKTYTLGSYCPQCGKINLSYDRDDKRYKKLMDAIQAHYADKPYVTHSLVFGSIPKECVDDALALFEDVFEVDDPWTDKYVSFARSIA